MRATESKVTTEKSAEAGLLLRLLPVSLLLAFCGCSSVSERLNLRSDKGPRDHILSETYNRTEVNKSLTLDVLPRIQGSSDEWLSQSESIVASVGQAKHGYRTWFTMVVFHEYELTAIRKYFFAVDERVRGRSSKSLRFDCEMAPPGELLNKTQGDENTKRIEMLRYVLKTLRSDIEDIRRDVDAPSQSNETLNVCALLLQHVFDTVLRNMDASPVLASKLHEPTGVEFSHLTFDKGRIGLVTEGNVLKVKLRLGALADRFEEPLEAPGSESGPGSM